MCTVKHLGSLSGTYAEDAAPTLTPCRFTGSEVGCLVGGGSALSRGFLGAPSHAWLGPTWIGPCGPVNFPQPLQAPLLFVRTLDVVF